MKDTIAIILKHEEQNKVFAFGNIRLMVACNELNVWDHKRSWHKIDRYPDEGGYLRFARDAKEDWRQIDTEGAGNLIAAINDFYEAYGEQYSGFIAYNDTLQQLNHFSNFTE